MWFGTWIRQRAVDRFEARWRCDGCFGSASRSTTSLRQRQFVDQRGREGSRSAACVRDVTLQHPEPPACTDEGSQIGPNWTRRESPGTRALDKESLPFTSCAHLTCGIAVRGRPPRALWRLHRFCGQARPPALAVAGEGAGHEVDEAASNCCFLSIAATTTSGVGHFLAPRQSLRLSRPAIRKHSLDTTAAASGGIPIPAKRVRPGKSRRVYLDSRTKVFLPALSAWRALKPRWRP